jgi:hypothetical protein
MVYKEEVMRIDQRGCLDDPRELWDRKICLLPVSKNVRGDLRLMDRELQTCDEDDCRTLKTDHVLKVEVVAHQPCDSNASGQLDGVFYVRRLITAFVDGNGENRGLHTGAFDWIGGGARVRGTLSGATNVGTHRAPVLDPCQECHAPGYMEGRLCGHIVRAKDERLRGCRVAASYRLRFDASEGAIDTGITGTIEGLIVCPCEKAGCLDLTGFPAMAHPNPWTVDAYIFLVHDFSGAPTATADVVTWGAFTGLNARFETRLTLASPADTVDITLVHFSSPATVTALDSAGTVIDTDTMTAAAGTAETLHLTGAGIEVLVVQAPQNETLILEICTP